MRPPKRPDAPLAAAASPGEVLASIRSRPSFGAPIEWEAMELGGFAVMITRFRKPVPDQLREWAALYPDYAVTESGERELTVARGGQSWRVTFNGAQAYAAGPAASVRALLEHPHDFIPGEVRASAEYRAVSMRVHLAGGSDQWVSRAKLEKFLATGRDGALTSLDWGQMPE